MAPDTIGNQPAPTGHPRGLYVLAATEMWERFSFYGMSALLTLYVSKELLLPANASQVWGLAGLRGVFDAVGPASDLALAVKIYGWYAGLVYFTPILGGWIADRLLGARRTVLIGVLLMSAGHLLMTFYASFLLALAMLILGSGCLKGNISAQVGALYPREAESLRTRGYTIFSTGINIGAATGPLATGAVAAAYGWHAGFALAGVLMLVALVTYLLGQHLLPDDRPRRAAAEPRAPLTQAERRRVTFLLAVVALVIPAEIAYPMIWNLGPAWLDHWVDLSTPLGTVPAAWFASADSTGSIISAALLVPFWAWQARRGKEPGEIGKIGIGTLIVAVALLLLVWGNLGHSAPSSVAVGWPLAAWLIMGLGWMYYWPTLLALISRCAPPSIASTLMGLAFMAPFIGHTLTGYIAAWYETMSPSAFWLLDAGIALAGGLVVLALRHRLARGIDPALQGQY